MLYCGHAYVDATAVGGDIGVRLLAATSTDGITWTKQDAPLLGADAALAWMSDGVAEPSMVQGPDGKWYLFFTGLHGDERAIGIAVAADPLGPWDVEPQPIITAASLGLPAGSRTVAPEAELVEVDDLEAGEGEDPSTEGADSDADDVSAINDDGRDGEADADLSADETSADGIEDLAA